MFHYEMCFSCFSVYLDGSHLEVDGDLVFPDLLQRCHGDADVIQVFDLPVQLLAGLVGERQDLLHFGAVLSVAVAAKVHDPALGLGREGQL